MWQKLSLHARINLLLAFVLALGLAINIARLVLEADATCSGRRSKRHHGWRANLSRRSSPALNEAPDPDARLNQIVRDLSRLRHVSITRQDDAAASPAEPTRSGGDDECGHRRHGLLRSFIRKRPRSACRSRFMASRKRL